MTMDKQIYCGNCGNNNPEKNNFCFNCGSKLDKLESGTSIEQTSKNNKFNDIETFLNDLIKYGGFITIVENDFYVQFMSGKGNDIVFEAVSRANLSKVGNKDNEFKSIGFSSSIVGNYRKTINSNKIIIKELIVEIRNIFFSIYGIQLSNYQINYEIYYNKDNKKTSYLNNNSENTTNSGVNYGLLIIVVVAIIIGYYSFENNNGEDSESQKEVVHNSSFDASVFQVERYLKKEYLKDPDSYQSISWSAVQQVNNNSQYKYYVRHKFRAKNGFGGYAIEEMIFYLDEQGFVVSTTDL
jgi:hypothetical protein